MKLYGDYHTHTRYSHGKGRVVDNARAAASAGLKEIAITDHGFRHMLHHVRRGEIPAMLADIKAAERETGVKILAGIESNLTGGDGSIDIKERDYAYLDLILSGFHTFVLPSRPRDMFRYFAITYRRVLRAEGARQREKNTDIYLRALNRYPIDVITHIGYGMRVNYGRVAKECADLGTYIELNGKRVNNGPRCIISRDDFGEMLETGVKFIMNSDAHSPGRVGDVAGPDEFLKNFTVPPDRIVNVGAAAPVFRSARFKRERGI